MSVGVTLATAARVLRQLRRDRRTLALVLLVPPFLLTIFRYVFDGQPQTFDRVGAPMVGIFPLISMFLVTSVAMLRERTTGTLERLMSTPLAKLDLLAGYGLAFAALAVLQAAVASAVAFGLLGLDIHGSIWIVFGFAVANAVLGMALGLLLSAFATTEFQAVQFMPAAILPQILLCGLLVPRERGRRRRSHSRRRARHRRCGARRARPRRGDAPPPYSVNARLRQLFVRSVTRRALRFA